MSLDVSVYIFDETGQRQWVRQVEGWRTAAGPEVWRTTVYGSEEAHSLGLTLLPSLAEGDIDVQGEELNRLGEEINLLIQNVALFAAIPPPLVRALKEERDEILARFTNIANAVTEAKELNGGVEIG